MIPKTQVLPTKFRESTIGEPIMTSTQASFQNNPFAQQLIAAQRQARMSSNPRFGTHVTDNIGFAGKMHNSLEKDQFQRNIR